jgi:histone H3/H4
LRALFRKIQKLNQALEPAKAPEPIKASPAKPAVHKPKAKVTTTTEQDKILADFNLTDDEEGNPDNLVVDDAKPAVPKAVIVQHPPVFVETKAAAPAPAAATPEVPPQQVAGKGAIEPKKKRSAKRSTLTASESAITWASARRLHRRAAVPELEFNKIRRVAEDAADVKDGGAVMKMSAKPDEDVNGMDLRQYLAKVVKEFMTPIVRDAVIVTEYHDGKTCMEADMKYAMLRNGVKFYGMPSGLTFDATEKARAQDTEKEEAEWVDMDVSGDEEEEESASEPDNDDPAPAPAAN